MCSQGQFYTYRRPDASGWVLRSAGLKGSGHGGSDAGANPSAATSTGVERQSLSDHRPVSLDLLFRDERAGFGTFAVEIVFPFIRL